MQFYQLSSTEHRGYALDQSRRDSTLPNSFKVAARTLVFLIGLIGTGKADAGESPTLLEVPMLSASGLPCVGLSAGDYPPLKMLLDSKSEMSVLDVTIAADMGLDVKPMIGPDGKPYAGCYVAIISDIRIGEVPIGDLQVKVVDLRSRIKKGTFPDADGSLAFSVLNGRIFRLDYLRHLVGISKLLVQNAQPPIDCGTLSHPAFGKNGPRTLVTTGFEINGRPITAQIDTLFAGTVLIYPTSVEKLGPLDTNNSARKLAFPYTDDGAETIEGLARSEGFNNKALKTDAPIYLATSRGHMPNGMFDGTVGNALFRGRVLTFDLAGQYFWLD